MKLVPGPTPGALPPILWRFGPRHSHLVERSELRIIGDRRSMVETANSVMKSLTGSHVLSRLDSTEETQILYKAITHNCKPTVERRCRQPENRWFRWGCASLLCSVIPFEIASKKRRPSVGSGGMAPGRTPHNSCSLNTGIEMFGRLDLDIYLMIIIQI